MAIAGDGIPRSNIRKKNITIGCRVTLEEYNKLQEKVSKRNNMLANNATKAATYTVQRFLIDAGLRRKLRSVALIYNDEEIKMLTELVRTLTRQGNLFRGWLENGDAFLIGNAKEGFQVHRDANAEEANTIKQILSSMKDSYDTAKYFINKEKVKKKTK